MASKENTIIKKVKSWRENLDLTRPYTIAYQTIESVENIFVYIEIEDGSYGIGSGSPADFITGESMDDSDEALKDHLESFLMGKDIRLLNSLCRDLQVEFPTTPAARMAVDIALHDVFTKWIKMPLAQYLGQMHKGIPTSKTIGIKPTIEETLAEADEHIATGFKIIKLKVGKEVDKDIDFTAKLRERVGNDIGIRVDANQGYNVPDLLKYVKGTEHLNIELIEQPLHETRVAEMLEVPDELREKCAADENLHSPQHALQLANFPQPFGIFNIKLMKCGGVYPALQIGQIAQLSGIDLMWGCMDESIISITAGLHAAFACPSTRYLDLDGSFDLARDIVSGGFILKDGLLMINDNPGLGVELLDEVAEKLK
jgi:L-alanine-DL-glutamate epimerase-like enolase superfamily enzyme